MSPVVSDSVDAEGAFLDHIVYEINGIALGVPRIGLYPAGSGANLHEIILTVIPNPATHEEDFGKWAVNVQFFPRRLRSSPRYRRERWAIVQ